MMAEPPGEVPIVQRLLLEPSGPELVFGIVGPVGTDTRSLADALVRELAELNYTSTVIHLSDLLEEWADDLIGKAPNAASYKERIIDLQDAGNKLREKLGRPDAVALAGLAKITEAREGLGVKRRLQALGRHAFILRSLKNPGEVELLRRIYRDRFVLLGANSPKRNRIDTLALKIARQNGHVVLDAANKERFTAEAKEVEERDEVELDTDLGQNVRDTFAEADVFLDARDSAQMVASLRRFLESFFHHPYITPTRDEFCMFHAEAAKLRSSALGRQVGAVVAMDGEILSIGCNEVPKANGLQYWPGDVPDKRDFQLGEEVSDRLKRETLKEILNFLRLEGWAGEESATPVTDEEVKELLSRMKGLRVANLIEFLRATHAEAAAILTAGLRGVSCKGATLYVTTFPCHECTRLIVTAGIARVYYISPYPKSMGAILHEDAISVDDPDVNDGKIKFLPFVGIGPRLYPTLFRMETRKKDARVVLWHPGKQLPRPELVDPTYLLLEEDEVATFQKLLPTAIPSASENIEPSQPRDL